MDEEMKQQMIYEELFDDLVIDDGLDEEDDTVYGEFESEELEDDEMIGEDLEEDDIDDFIGSDQEITFEDFEEIDFSEDDEE